MENLIIIGSGPAGYTAAFYAARANLKPLMITGGSEEGGQLMLTSEVENFPGFPEGILGQDLMKKLREQAKRFGTRLIDEKADKFNVKGKTFDVYVGKKKYQARAVIIATGASAMFLGLESEKKYLGHGVSTCAVCDAFFYKEKEVLVIGGGDSACEEALALSKFARNITIVHRRNKLKASKIMQDRVFKNKRIKIVWDSDLIEVLGDGTKVTGAKLRNNKTNKVIEKKCNGIFMAIGHKPNTGIFNGIIKLDEKGYVITDRNMATNVKGVWAAGDVQDSRYKQAVTAAGTGCQAALEAEKYLESNSP